MKNSRFDNVYTPIILIQIMYFAKSDGDVQQGKNRSIKESWTPKTLTTGSIEFNPLKYVNNTPRVIGKQQKRQGLIKNIIIISEQDDLRHSVLKALTDIRAFNVEMSVYESDIVRQVVFGVCDRSITQGNEHYKKYYTAIIKVLYQLHKERLLVYGYESAESFYTKWYICLNPLSKRRCFGQFGDHFDMWDTYSKLEKRYIDCITCAR